MTAKTFIKSILIICFFFIENKSFGQNWSQKANIPSGAGSYINFSTDGKGYMIAPLSTALLEYNPATNTWTTKAAFPGTPRESAVAFSIGNKGYVATGVQASGGLLNDLWEYNAIGNTWTQKANFPGGARQNAIAFSVGSKGYLGTGYDGAIKNDFWEYDPSTNVWTQKTDFGGGVRAEAVGFSIGNKGYIGTGTSSLNNTGLTNDLWEFNPTTNSWTQKANLPAPARVVAIAFSLGMKAYLGTGSGDVNAGPGPYYHDFWKYDPSTNTWTSQPDYPGSGSFLLSGFSVGANAYVGAGEGGALFSDFWQFNSPNSNVGTWIVKGTSPTARRGEAAATSNGIVYVLGGAPPFSTNSVATAEAYNPATNSWTTLASMPIASQQLTAQSINGIIYAVAGGGCCGAYSDVQAYNPATNTWTLKASAPTARYGATSAVVNNKMYVMSGGSGYGTLYQNLEVYDPVTNSWTTKAPMPFFRGGCAAIAVNGIIYAIGGGDPSGTIMGTVQAYDPSTDSWSIKSDMPTPRGGLTVAVHNNKIYAIGGNNNTDGDIGIVEIYDPATDTWTSGPPLAPALQSLASATVNNKLYTFGGTIPAFPNSPVLTVEELTPACPVTESSTAVIACNQYLWNGVVYTTSGDKTYTTTNAAGCDSIATLHLTINHSTTSSTAVTACDQYLWNGVVYTTSGDKTYTTTNAAGCDSIATLHLTINYNTTSSTTVTACDQYLWNGVVYTTSGDKTYTTTNAAGCDSVATLHLTINHSTTSSTIVTACGQYLWNGVVYTTSGDKTYTTTNAAGCDSIATLHLTIINGPTVPLITCPSGNPFIRSTNSSCNYTIMDGEFNATATATCGTPTLSYVLTGATTGAGSATLSGTVLNKGITTISWTATNGSLTSTCSFTVNVVDNQAPVITCPGNISTTLKGKNCNTKIKMLNPTYADNCGPITTLTWVMSGATSGSSPATGINNLGSQTFNAGITTVVYTAKDAAGNSSSCSYTVNVINPNCPNSLITKASEDIVKTKESLVTDLTISVNPNPSPNYFTLKMESDNLEQKVSLRILDLLGRLVETRNKLNVDQTLQIGHNYKPGIYIAEIMQGNRRNVVKFVKL